jgi:DnaJ-class molecular chaperone
MEQKDYYQILEVDRTADQQTVREAYRKLAFQFHPDRNKGSLDAAEKMKDLNEAYAVLSDKRKRGEYDTLRQQFGPSAYNEFRQGYSDQDIFRGSDINQIFEEMSRAFGFRGFDDIFKACYGEQCQTFEFRRPGFFWQGVYLYGPFLWKGFPSRGLCAGGKSGKAGKVFFEEGGRN